MNRNDHFNWDRWKDGRRMTGWPDMIICVGMDERTTPGQIDSIIYKHIKHKVFNAMIIFSLPNVIL